MGTEINHRDIVVPLNHVLIKPDEDFKFFHNEKGEETGIHVATSFRQYKNPNSEWDYEEEEVLETISQNLSYSGTVIKTPRRINFDGYAAERYFKENQHILEDITYTSEDEERMRGKRKVAMKCAARLQEIRENSLQFDVDIEINEGDKVYYDFMEKFSVYKNGLVLDTDIGELYLIRYDKLEMVVRDGNVHPLNMNVLIEWKSKEEISYGSLTLAASPKKIYETSGIQEGVVVGVPTQAKGFLNPEEKVSVHNMNLGECVVFKPEYAYYLENENHYTLFGGREILRIRAHNILFKKDGVQI